MRFAKLVESELGVSMQSFGDMYLIAEFFEKAAEVRDALTG